MRSCGVQGVAARALEFTILCSTRTGETLDATWQEIDLDNAVWAIPGSRTKRGVYSRVPLSDTALALLRALTQEDNPYLFIGRSAGARLGATAMFAVVRSMGRNATVHGFRSTFRDWAAEVTSHENIVVEKALGHSIGNAVEAAYRRGDLFEKRRVLMSDWANYVDGLAAVDNVVLLARTATA